MGVNFTSLADMGRGRIALAVRDALVLGEGSEELSDTGRASAGALRVPEV